MIASNRTGTDPPEDVSGPTSRTDDAERPPRTRYSYLIALLGQLDGTVTIDRVADAVHRWEHEHADAGSDRDWYDVHEELFRVDLPVLDRADVVEFDRTRGLVSDPATPTARPEQGRPPEGSGLSDPGRG